MSISNTNPQPKDVVILQRDDLNTVYGETHISGSSLIIYIDENGDLNADNSSSFYTNFPPSANTISSSYALTASFALNGGNSTGSGAALTTGSTYQITASNAISSSYTQTASFALNFNNPVKIFAWAVVMYDGNSLFSSSYNCNISRSSIGVYPVSFLNSSNNTNYSAIINCWSGSNILSSIPINLTQNALSMSVVNLIAWGLPKTDFNTSSLTIMSL